MKTEIFYIAPGYTGPPLDLAIFDGPGWYFWGGTVPEGDVEGPYATRQDAERRSAERDMDE